ncbi:MAG: aspartate 1-decarboxylase [Candidatus Omnitrophica bacterium]|jgi:aspartate 1-decarboxylase|nr:aspartate 1-decarboxylase [Candidatus Omnitrophota bacterium]
MLRVILKSKVHNARVTQANIRYEGSITIDRDIMRAANLVAFERVQVSSLSTGMRLETYVIEGGAGTGVIGLNGAAAKLVKKNEVVHIMSYAWMDDAKTKKFKPLVIHLNDKNHVRSVARGNSK